MENNNTMATEILKELKNSNKRTHIMCIILLVCWISTIIGFLYYLSLYDFVSDTTQTIESVENSDIEQSTN